MLPSTAPDSALPVLTLEGLKTCARQFARDLSATQVPALYGATDGKAVGTFVESEFNISIASKFRYAQGNAAKGIDFPGLEVDLKVTSLKQPQSSCPFRDATQKVYGLGYSLLVFVYVKTDDHHSKAANLDIRNVVFISHERTGDYQLTRGVQSILKSNGNVDDIDAYLQDRNLPLDDDSRRALAERIVSEPPLPGYVTISNALQWRLQYGHAIKASMNGNESAVEDLIG